MTSQSDDLTHADNISHEMLVKDFGESLPNQSSIQTNSLDHLLGTEGTDKSEEKEEEDHLAPTDLPPRQSSPAYQQIDPTIVIETHEASTSDGHEGYQQEQDQEQEQEHEPQEPLPQATTLEEPQTHTRTWNLWVGNLTPNTTESELSTVFSECGNIHSVHILRNPVTKQHKGFAFIHFTSPESRSLALRLTPTPVLHGNELRTAASQKQCSLRIRGLPADTTYDELTTLLSTRLDEKLMSGLSLKTRVFTPRFKRFASTTAFIELPSKPEAEQVYNLLSEAPLLAIKGVEVRPDWAGHDTRPVDPSAVYLAGLRAGLQSSEVSESLAEYGRVLSVAPRGAGWLVHFAEPEGATSALQAAESGDLAVDGVVPLASAARVRPLPREGGSLRGHAPRRPSHAYAEYDEIMAAEKRHYHSQGSRGGPFRPFKRRRGGPGWGRGGGCGGGWRGGRGRGGAPWGPTSWNGDQI
eukprot:gnl/Dysnectes_brevis/2754_a3352_961.p1 GENE.gnl/Dysnectes_brevis/2754_a3352_961~~gnl/Dysnectes_brevis/2754_a3352_961.p1  ORF type:complete len:468 (-),score=50.47 gnl/Dysnectes_brevis/2754_a3352_961:1064-2467(-)